MTYEPYDEEAHKDRVLAAADAEGEDHEAWFGDGPADWDRIWGRIEDACGVDLGSQTDASVFGQIRRAYNKAKREAS